MTDEHIRTSPNDPRQAEIPLPITWDADRTPVDAQGRYVPHHHDEANTVHFFSVIDRPSDSPLPEIAALTDLLEQHDGHYPPDYESDYEPDWEPLTSKEWEAYRDHVRVITENVYDTGFIHDHLPTATPHLADDALISASIQPDAPYPPGRRLCV